MIISKEDLRALSLKELKEYLWKRLRFEYMNPDFSNRFSLESPEFFIIDCFLECPEDSAFYRRLILAIKLNLKKILEMCRGAGVDDVTAKQIASLAFLVEEMHSDLVELAIDNGFCTLKERTRVPKQLVHLGKMFIKVGELRYVKPTTILTIAGTHVEFVINLLVHD